MGLSLSSQQVASFVALQDTLLSPLEHESVDAWCASVTRMAEKLLNADRSAFFLPFSGQFHYVSESIDPKLLKAYEERIEGVESGALRYRESGLEHAMAARRSIGIEVWSVKGMARRAGVRLEGLPVYHEHIKPAGIAHSRVITVVLPQGETFLGIGHSNARSDPFKEEDGLELMSLLLPAFKAGVGTIVRLEGQREQLGRTLDDLAEAVAILTAGGRECHRSRRLRQLLESDPERDVLEEQIRWMAIETGRVPSGGREAPPVIRGQREVVTAAGRYVLRASLVGRGVFGLRHAVLVSVESVTPRLPSPRSLQDHYGLTPREAEVALLMADGASNAAMARRLGISPHTVRHHAERVFEKLGIHSRKALALRLLASQDVS